LPSSSGTHELCLTFNGERHRSLWAIERVQLLTAQECKEGLDKSILDLSARRQSGTCPDWLTPNQMLTHLIAGKPSLVCGTCELVQRFRNEKRSIRFRNRK